MENSLGDCKRRLPILWHLAWPAIIEQYLSMLVSFVDTAMVGSLGSESTAAVSVVTTSIWLVNGVFAGVGVGFSVQVANAIGAGDYARSRRVIRQSVLAVGAIGLLALVVMECLGGFLPVWLGAEDDVIPLAVSYIRLYSLGLPFSAALSVFSSIFRCTGNTKVPLALNGLANAANIVMNFFLIYPTRHWRNLPIVGAGLGVKGAAIATAASMALSGVLITRSLIWNRNRPVSVSPDENYKPDKEIIMAAAKLGLPYMAERVTVNLGQILTTSMVAYVGTVALAANHIADVAEGMCYMPAYGISYAATSLVGQAVGAKNKEDAMVFGRIAGILGFCMSTVTGTLLFVLAPQISGLFTSDEEVIAVTTQVLRIIAFAEPLFAVSITLSGALQGAKDIRFPMFVALGSMWGIRIVLSLILVYRAEWGLSGVWFAMGIDLIVRGILCALRWRSRKWQKISGLTA